MSYEYKALPSREPKRRVHFRDDSDDLDSLDSIIVPSSEEFNNWSTGSKLHRIFTSRWLWLIHAVLFMTSFILFAFTVAAWSSNSQHIKRPLAWSPAAPAVKYEPVRYNITTKGNRFVGAGPDVDMAWREISYDMGDQWIPSSDIAKLDMPLSSLKVNHPETGEEGYRVGMEVFHQLHCINLLRRIVYKDYYEPLGGEFAAGPEALQRHADHCIEVLRLNIQCNADVGLFTFYMIEGDPLAWPQLNSKHVCRNFDRVVDWARSNSVGNMELLEEPID